MPVYEFGLPLLKNTNPEAPSELQSSSIPVMVFDEACATVRELLCFWA